MSYISATLFTSFVLLLTYSILINCASAKVANSGENGATSELQQKRPAPAVWLKSFPLRRLKPFNGFSVYRRDLQPEVEFIDDSINDVEKRFDDYGHMR
jgi:hypothetical protein